MKDFNCLFFLLYLYIPWEQAYTIFQDKKRFYCIVQYVFKSVTAADQVVKFKKTRNKFEFVDD